MLQILSVDGGFLVAADLRDLLVEDTHVRSCTHAILKGREARLDQVQPVKELRQQLALPAASLARALDSAYGPRCPRTRQAARGSHRRPARQRQAPELVHAICLRQPRSSGMSGAVRMPGDARSGQAGRPCARAGRPRPSCITPMSDRTLLKAHPRPAASPPVVVRATDVEDLRDQIKNREGRMA
jgi:hypothetical protein